MKYRILIVDDEPAISDTIQYALETEGFETVCLSSGMPVMPLLARELIDLIVLDIGLPDINGFELCREIRKCHTTPVIFLTARSDEIDRVVGLEIGADDYIVKPFSPRELSARVRAVLRRMQARSPENSANNAFHVNESKRQITYFGRALELSHYEYRILTTFIRRPGHVYSRDQLMDMAWEVPESSMDRTVDAHIKNIRAKLKIIKPDLEPIVTHRGMGYSLRGHMKLGTRIFFCYLIIFTVCFYYSFDWMKGKIRTRYLEGVEEPLVDQANIMAAIIGNEMESGRFDVEKMYRVFKNVYDRPLAAKIYDMMKNNVDTNIYITDAKGKVIFDAKNRKNIGMDYTRWRDVRLTLAGRYGARTTRLIVDDPTTSVLHIAAPIYVHGDLVGVLTVAKPTTNINIFIECFKPEFSRVAMISMIAAIILSILASIWLTLPIKRLTKYAIAIGEGKRVEFPKLDTTEIGDMGKAFAKMQTALEGKKYVEQYIQTLTHEIKSPVSAILGAAELLEEKMEPPQRARFLANIRNEATRIHAIVERLLELSALENKKILEKIEDVSCDALIKTVVESKQPILTKKTLIVSLQIDDNLQKIKGDGFLLHEALANLVQNAIDFSPPGGKIDITARADGKTVKFIVEDCGPGMPDFAKDKIFDRFYSLQRPDTGKKSTGLGLNFVREAATLHKGQITLENRIEKGMRATLTLPV